MNKYYQTMKLVICLHLFSDEFANLDSSLSMDWSTSIGSVIYTVQVTKLPENVSTPDVLLQIDPPLSEFKFNESNICKLFLTSIHCFKVFTQVFFLIMLCKNVIKRVGKKSLRN